MLKRLLQVAALLLVLNEIRGVIMSLPVLYGMMQLGGDTWALVMAISYLIGLAISVWVPIRVYRKLKARATQ